MVCSVQCRTDQIIHSGVEDKEILRLTSFYKQHSGNQCPALGHYRSARFQMQTLSVPAMVVLNDSLEPCLEMCHRITVRVFIIHTEPTSEIDIRDMQPFILKP